MSADGCTVETEVTSVDELVELVGVPLQRVAEKVRPALADLDRQWIAASPFGLVATVLFLIPGRGDTLRVNGRARVTAVLAKRFMRMTEPLKRYYVEACAERLYRG